MKRILCKTRGELNKFYRDHNTEGQFIFIEGRPFDKDPRPILFTKKNNRWESRRGVL